MKNKIETQKEGQGPAAPKPIVRIVLSIVIIIAGIAGARYLIHTKPKVNRRPPEKMAPLVKTAALHPETYTFNIPAMGTVMPAREISLEVPVSGEVVDLHPEFTEGGMLVQGTKILKIDPEDYEVILQQKRKALAEAEYTYKLEQGHQDVARREWNLLYGDQAINEGESDLALRKPHLEKVQVEIETARAELEQARINLDKTSVEAPFNALVLKKYVDLGSQVSQQEKLADLVGIDAYWVQVSLPVDSLKWIQIPNGKQNSGSEVEVLYRGNFFKSGRVIRLLPDLSKEGRMARLLIEVNDPLELQTKEPKLPMLLLGEYVRVSITGEELHNVFRIPRSALHNDREVWIVNEDDKLEIRPVKTIYRNEDTVLVRDGFKDGEDLVVSSIAAPVAGMDLRVEQAGKMEQQSDKSLQQK